MTRDIYLEALNGGDERRADPDVGGLVAKRRSGRNENVRR